MCPFQSPVHRSNEASQGVEHDIKLLVEGIKRLGAEKDGEIFTTFGEIFKDEALEQQLESLVGSLKAAKKRGILTFEGEMLLQGGERPLRPVGATPAMLLPGCSLSELTLYPFGEKQHMTTSSSHSRMPADAGERGWEACTTE